MISHMPSVARDGIDRMLASAGTSSSGNSSSGTSGSSANLDSQAFENALTQALDQALANLGVTNSSVSVTSSTSASGQNQFVVTMGSSGSTSTAPSNPSTTTTTPATETTTPSASTSNATSAATGSSGTSSTGSSSSSGSTTPEWQIEDSTAWMDAEKQYWADQPAAVQQLEYTPLADRASLANTLQGEGYNIDVPIMVWGWDPIKTEEIYRAYGDPYNASLLQQAGV